MTRQTQLPIGINFKLYMYRRYPMWIAMFCSSAEMGFASVRSPSSSVRSPSSSVRSPSSSVRSPSSSGKSPGGSPSGKSPSGIPSGKLPSGSPSGKLPSGSKTVGSAVNRSGRRWDGERAGTSRQSTRLGRVSEEGLNLPVPSRA
ncbi:uncharacterized protein SCHCODRAFT_02189290 [Schizophyllum commune H4-8]|uniref:uncharacterized protein n=1 Tax=Schizophyllum commune (strain H4-8 / FGSC 9210) TaxID=578458 RepID=UPI00215FF9B6|nr:uncharacterized protein SCHCODRAFT_02189290 [Schizophyllum commune H4-8]KAI5896367.1 hypothetical protein SCHCODRAFT_02189290 [Schizophyllum commune H4-8]